MRGSVLEHYGELDGVMVFPSGEKMGAASLRLMQETV